MALTSRSRETWLNGVLSPKLKVNEPIRNWLVGGSWIPQAGMTNKRLTAEIYSHDQLSDYFVSETIKLSIAAMSSCIQIENNTADNRSCAWQLVRYYYSAYYAANALMRLSGHACTNLGALECSAINTTAELYGVGGNAPKDKLSGGVFHLKINQGPTPNFSLGVAPGKGVHVQLWLVFLAYLKDLKSKIRLSPAPKIDRDNAVKEIESLEKEFSREGGGWLSEVRNAVNYRFEHSAWYPYAPLNVDRSTLRNSFKIHAQGGTIFTPAAATEHELTKAVRVCGFLIGWLTDSLNVITSTARDEKKTLIERGVLELSSKI